MALISRVSRLFRADLHAVLDRIEEPDVLLKQAVREMEEDIGRDEKRVKLLTHEHGRLGARLVDIDRSFAQLEEEMDICFASQKDDLARSIIRRKLEAQQTQTVLAKKREQVADALAELKQRLQEHRTRLTSMQQKLELLAEDGSQGRDDEFSTAPDIKVREEDVEVAFLREKQKRGRS